MGLIKGMERVKVEVEEQVAEQMRLINERIEAEVNERIEASQGISEDVAKIVLGIE